MRHDEKNCIRYLIWVKPVGENGEGEDSNRTAVTTDTAEPSAPYITNATCYEALKIYLEWKRPKIYYRNVDYYYIYYKSVEAADYSYHKIQGSTDDDQKFFLEKSTSKLLPSNKYVIRICAGTKSTNTDKVIRLRTDGMIAFDERSNLHIIHVL